MGKNQDPGSGINIPDPQHCFLGGLGIYKLYIVFDRKSIFSAIKRMFGKKYVY
jgi:hypothetical protein